MSEYKPDTKSEFSGYKIIDDLSAKEIEVLGMNAGYILAILICFHQMNNYNRNTCETGIRRKSFTMRIIHWILGSLILFIDWLTTPKGIQRPVEMQIVIDEQSQNFTLYQYKACPFCVKVRRSLKRLSLPVETRDPKRCENAKKELIVGAGKLKVPCLKIDEGVGRIQWLFNSKDIISYLERRFA